MKNIEPAIIYQRRNIVGLAITYSCRITCTAIIQPCIPNFISQMRKLTFSSLVRSKTGFFPNDVILALVSIICVTWHSGHWNGPVACK